MTGDHYRITEGDVIEARRMMRGGRSMRETAILLGVLSGDLDRALWECFGRTDEDLMPPRLHAPDF